MTCRGGGDVLICRLQWKSTFRCVDYNENRWWKHFALPKISKSHSIRVITTADRLKFRLSMEADNERNGVIELALYYLVSICGSVLEVIVTAVDIQWYRTYFAFSLVPDSAFHCHWNDAWKAFWVSKAFWASKSFWNPSERMQLKLSNWNSQNWHSQRRKLIIRGVKSYHEHWTCSLLPCVLIKLPCTRSFIYRAEIFTGDLMIMYCFGGAFLLHWLW